VHLHQSGALGAGDVTLSWIRRGRIDADRWEGEDIPLGEDQERYRLRLLRGDRVLREEQLSQPSWVYAVSDQTTDAAAPGDQIEVAQISARYGAGAAGRLRLL